MDLDNVTASVVVGATCTCSLISPLLTSQPTQSLTHPPVIR